MSDTPETDAVEQSHAEWEDVLNHARKMESERNAYKAEWDALQAAVDNWYNDARLISRYPINDAFIALAKLASKKEG